MDSSNLVFRRPNSLIFSYPKGKKSLENILSSPYKRFRSPNSFNFPLLTRMVQGKLKSNFQMFNNKKKSSTHPAFTPGQEIDKVGLAQNARSTKLSASDSN